MIFQMNIYKVYLIFIFLFLFLASLSQTFLPSQINGVGVAFVMILMPYFIIKNVRATLSRIAVGTLLLLIFLSAFSFIALGEDILDPRVWSFYIVLLLAFSIEKGILFYIQPIKIFIYLNLLVLIWEKATGQFFIPASDASNYNYGVNVYGQGFFSYTKDAAEFLSIAIFLFRNDIKVKFVIFISTLLIGVRAAIFLVIIIIIIDFLILMRYDRKLFYRIMVILSFIMIVNYLISENYIYTMRYSSSFDVDSNSYSSRFYIVGKHLECYLNLPILSQLFGSGFYCSNLNNWGSESFPVQVLTYYGFSLFFLYFVLFCTILLNMMKYPRQFYELYPFVVVIFVGFFVRFPIGWFGGGIFFSLLFQALLNKKQWKYNIIGLQIKKNS